MRYAPKLLPWLARRAGVSDALALRLWRRAAAEAEAIAGDVEDPQYASIALDRLLNLLEVESNGEANFEPSQHAWMWRHTQRMARCAIVASVSISRIWAQAARVASRRQCACH